MEKKPTLLLSLAQSEPPTYARAIEAAGGRSIGGYLPREEWVTQCDGLVLGGGGDVEPAWYGQENWACDTVDGERDWRERQLIGLAVEKKIPILGICRGIQLLNVVFGGDLIQDIGASHSMTQGQYRLHLTRTLPGSQLNRLYGAEPVTNSGHHQVIGRLASGFQATQWAWDGVIEGIEHLTLPILAVQWHPEQLCPPKKRTKAVSGEPLFRWFLRRWVAQSE